jgi:hypothetical protein
VTAAISDPASDADRGTVSVPIAFGELIDKITILRIKLERLTDAAKLANVRQELELLSAARGRLSIADQQIEAIETELKQANESLWDIEDRIRDCEREKNFGPVFVELARSVYMTNDHRAELKRRLNELAGSSIVEEKSYTAY